MSAGETGPVYPVLPLKNTVLFPSMVMPLSVGRPRSVSAVEAAAMSEDKFLVSVAQRDAEIEEPNVTDLFTIGVRTVIKQMARGENGLQVIVQGVERVAIQHVEQTEKFLRGVVRPLPLPTNNEVEAEALHREILEQVGQMQELVAAEAPIDLNQLAAQIGDPVRQVYLLASFLGMDLEKQQSLLEAPSREALMRQMHEYLGYEVQVLRLRTQIAHQAASEMNREQRRYLLRQQMRAIQQELGEDNPEKAEVNLLRERFEEAKLPESVRKEAERELKRLESLSPAAPDYQMTRAYLELVLELPWEKTTDDNLDISHARQVLDEDHYDLQEIKGRILEHLAVLKLNPQAHAPILCFVGPPGTGKTSLGQSIARAMGREFERMSLGGMHDEAELRGHRRTYIGAMPGRVIQAVRRAGVRNPVLMLDEVDKIGRDFRGDPAAALLEILDPAQNDTFRDNYLDMPFDLSKVFFIATANTLDTIPGPLLDRMEVLRLTGYSETEKLQIARKYLIPRELKEAGLSSEQLAIPDETVRHVINRYTREAGLRQLSRTLGRLARKAAIEFAEGRTEPMTIRPENLGDMLGPERFFLERVRKELPPGVATGLAWTEAGGDVLYVEAALLPAERGLTLTGQLGDVMRESAKAAQSFIRSHAAALGIPERTVRRSGVHIHVPAGAIPKDGPSAGIAMATALASLYTNLPVRSDTAMTGEITLTGLALPVGGIKEKVLAAHRAGIRRVILPRENEKDLRELGEPVKSELEFILVDQVEEALASAIPELAARLASAPAASHS